MQDAKISKFYKANLSTKSCFDISELEDIFKNCSECKRLPETKKVAPNTRRCQKVAEQLMESPNCLACEFMVHYACKKAEMNLKSTTTDGFNFRIMNSLMESWKQSPLLTTVISSLQKILYSIRTKESYFMLFSAFRFAIVCSRYSDEETRIY